MEQLETRTVYANAWMTVREDQVLRPDGSIGLYGVVDKPDFALVIPREPRGMWLVEQYRYPVGRRAWELPQGSWSGTPDGDQAGLAAAELAEETGLRAGRLVRLGHCFGAYGFCSQGFDVFLATELTPGPTAREPSERDMVHRYFGDDELVELVAGGQLVDAPSLAALALLRYHEEGRLPAG